MNTSKSLSWTQNSSEFPLLCHNTINYFQFHELLHDTNLAQLWPLDRILFTQIENLIYLQIGNALK